MVVKTIKKMLIAKGPASILSFLKVFRMIYNTIVPKAKRNYDIYMISVIFWFRSDPQGFCSLYKNK